MRKKEVGDAADDPDFDESDDELNILPVGAEVKGEDEMEANVNDAPLSDFVEDNIGYFDGIDGDDEDDEDELDVMKEVAEKIPNEDHSFMIGHPQRNTHSAHMKRENYLVVPNFLPNTLPRPDRGDQEHYCCTMLTLFKPWHSGKSKEQSWDKSFLAHEFTK